MQFDGLRVLSLESRRSHEIERLIRARGGVPFVAPSMREVPLSENSEAFAFAERLFSQQFEMMILLTGVGTRLLGQAIETRYPMGSFAAALRKLTVVARGSKPMAVAREWDVPVAIVVPEPNTWREILSATAGRPERRIAVQEYGRPSTELIGGLRDRGAEVTSVPIYQWDLPEDTGPLREAVQGLCGGRFDVVMFTTSIQVPHLLRVASEMGVEEGLRAALARVVVASVGPTTSETLADSGIARDFQPSHPKMGFLVNEISESAHEILRTKR
jgi:uroporphyrinogen-III synthase